jgi:uncharacterized protein (UPF0303 family)
VSDQVEALRKQEEWLQFENFDEHVAWKIGCWLQTRAVADELPVVIDIRLGPWSSPEKVVHLYS